jgi:hypothetical protein
MKYSIRPTPEPPKPEPPEKEVEFWLEQNRYGEIVLKGCVVGSEPLYPNILFIQKNGQTMLACGVNENLGLKLDPYGKIDCQ